jgi:formylglycine-generating enzyme required for sulfatase activity
VETGTCSHESSHTTTRTGTAALGHNYGNWTLTAHPTLTADGVETRVCSYDPSHKEARDIPDTQTGVWIKAGNFTMGSPQSETLRMINETQHTVTFTKGFYMGKHQVTQELYERVMGVNPSIFDFSYDPETNPAKCPVEYVNWYDALVFCNTLSILEGLSPVYSIGGNTDPEDWGSVPTTDNATWNAVVMNRNANGYRLPTEAEWEYACRAGKTTPFNWGTSTITESDATYDATETDPYYNRVEGEFRLGTTEVGKYAPNAWGLYDMHGNVREWVWDWLSLDYGGLENVTDPTGAGPDSGTIVRRGGGWDDRGQELRAAFRDYSNPASRWINTGLRLVCGGD